MFSLIKLAARLLASSVETPRCRIFNNVIIAGQDIVHFGNKSYLLLAEKMSARGSPEESGGTGFSPAMPAIPRPFEGTSASDLDRTYEIRESCEIKLLAKYYKIRRSRGWESSYFCEISRKS